MAKINGTYVSLHEACDDYPFYKGNLEFNGTLCLADYFEKVGSYDTSDTYQFRGIPYTNKELSAPKIPETEALLAGRIPNKALLFTESNSAHHLTYFYVKEAARHLLDGDKLLVVNFDQHEDTGGNDSIFYCGSWGGNRICNAVGCDYLVVGKDMGRAKLYTGEGYGTSYPTDSLTSIYEKYDRIYVTVDMDVLDNPDNSDNSDTPKHTNRSGNNSDTPKCTNWGWGNMTLKLLKECLAELPAGKLIAADITGFPPVSSENAKNCLERLDVYINNICETAYILCNLMGILPFID